MRRTVVLVHTRTTLGGFTIISAPRTALVAIALTASTLTFAGPAEAGLKYANCTALARDYKHGVAKSHKAAMKQVRQGYGRPAYGTRAKKVYWANYKSMDRDKDGTACER